MLVEILIAFQRIKELFRLRSMQFSLSPNGNILYSLGAGIRFQIIQ